MRKRSAAVLVWFWAVSALAQGQSAHAPNVRVVTVASEALKGSRRAAVMLPPGYDNSPARYPVLYLLHGLTGNWEDWSRKTNLAAYAAAYSLIIVMPDGENSWYTNSAVRPDYRYEDFIVREMVSYVDTNYRSIADRHARAIAGLSMGGYGAMKLGLKFPQVYSALGSFSGALGLAQPGLKPPAGMAAKSLSEAFGSDDEARKLNDPFTIATKLAAVRPAIYFDCGNGDRLLDSNRKFADLLLAQKVAYEYREPPGEHNWEYWDRQIQEFLRWLAREWRLGPSWGGPRPPGPIPAGPPGAFPPPPR